MNTERLMKRLLRLQHDFTTKSDHYNFKDEKHKKIHEEIIFFLKKARHKMIEMNNIWRLTEDLNAKNESISCGGD